MSSQVVALTPFTVRRIALWRDCDPAGVVYAGNFSDYLLDATALLRRHVFGLGWRAIRETTGVDTPAKALSPAIAGRLIDAAGRDHAGAGYAQTFILTAIMLIAGGISGLAPLNPEGTRQRCSILTSPAGKDIVLADETG